MIEQFNEQKLHTAKHFVVIHRWVAGFHAFDNGSTRRSFTTRYIFPLLVGPCHRHEFPKMIYKLTSPRQRIIHRKSIKRPKYGRIPLKKSRLSFHFWNMNVVPRSSAITHAIVNLFRNRSLRSSFSFHPLYNNFSLAE